MTRSQTLGPDRHVFCSVVDAEWMDALEQGDGFLMR